MNSVLRQCLDPYTGEDLAGEIRQYFLPDDFSNWKDHDSFERAFAALLRDLRAQAQRTRQSAASLCPPDCSTCAGVVGLWPTHCQRLWVTLLKG